MLHATDINSADVKNPRHRKKLPIFAMSDKQYDELSLYTLTKAAVELQVEIRQQLTTHFLTLTLKVRRSVFADFCTGWLFPYLLRDSLPDFSLTTHRFPSKHLSCLNKTNWSLGRIVRVWT
jgi:hypothetical protein